MNVVLILLAFISCCWATPFTNLEIDNHPCKPENLKRTNRYFCDSNGTVICQTGWRKPQLNNDPLNDLNPCLEPVCDFGGETCLYGECRAPNFCACEVGWEGSRCDVCVPLPGCDNGHCYNAFECNCEPGWEGAYCDIAVCEHCGNGKCVAPNDCVCLNGWEGTNCDVCQKRPGCVHGDCGSHPNTCECHPGWEGPLCDTAVCTPTCVHGFCHSAILANGTLLNRCICNSGWRGESCNRCRPYWRCPNQRSNACHKPNQCLCTSKDSDPEMLCNISVLTEKVRSLGLFANDETDDFANNTSDADFAIDDEVNTLDNSLVTL